MIDAGAKKSLSRDCAARGLFAITLPHSRDDVGTKGMRGHAVIRTAPELALAAALSAALAGCGPNYSPNTYSAAAVQQANKVEQGVIVGVRQIDITSPGTTGAVVGAAAG